MTATIVHLRSARLTGGAAPTLIAEAACGCDHSIRLATAAAVPSFLGARFTCHGSHPCACKMPERAGFHSEAGCGLADGSVTP